MAKKRLGSGRRYVKFDIDTLEVVIKTPKGIHTLTKLPKELKACFEHTVIQNGKKVYAVFVHTFFSKLDAAETLSAKGDYAGAAKLVLEAINVLEEAWANVCRGFLNRRRLVGGFITLICTDENLHDGFTKGDPECAISYTAWQKLCEYNPRWKTATHLKVHTYPALSPYSVGRCKFIVYMDNPQPPAITTIGESLSPAMIARLNELKEEEQNLPPLGYPILEPLFLAPAFCLAGGRDCDGDSIEALPSGHGSPTFRRRGNPLPMPSKSGNAEAFFETEMKLKCDKALTELPTLAAFYTKQRASSNLIAPLTNCFDFACYILAKNSDWVGGVREACERYFHAHVETSFDQRKPGAGEIEATKKFISEVGTKIRQARKNLNLYAILNCSKINKGFIEAIEPFETWTAAMTSMFGKLRKDRFEQDSLEVLPLMGEDNESK